MNLSSERTASYLGEAQHAIYKARAKRRQSPVGLGFFRQQLGQLGDIRHYAPCFRKQKNPKLTRPTRNARACARAS